MRYEVGTLEKVVGLEVIYRFFVVLVPRGLWLALGTLGVLRMFCRHHNFSNTFCPVSGLMVFCTRHMFCTHFGPVSGHLLLGWKLRFGMSVHAQFIRAGFCACPMFYTYIWPSIRTNGVLYTPYVLYTFFAQYPDTSFWAENWDSGCLSMRNLSAQGLKLGFRTYIWPSIRTNGVLYM